MGGFQIGIGQDPGAAEGALSAHIRAAQALREAAMQQAQKDAQDRQQDFKDQMEMIQQGAIPMNAPATGGTINTGGLGTRTADNPAAAGVEGTVLTDPKGRQWKIPSASEKAKEKLDDTNSFIPTGELSDRLAAAGVKPGARVKFADAHGLIETLNAAQPNAKVEIRETTGADGTIHFFKIAKDGSDVKEIYNQADAGKGTAAAKPKGYEYSKETDDAGKVSVTRFNKDDAEAGPELWNGTKWVPLPAGARLGKAKDTSEADARRQKLEDDKQQKIQDDGQKQINALQKEEQQQHGLRSQYGQALATKDGDLVIDPATNKQVPMTPARRKQFQGKYTTATDQVGRLQDTQKKLILRLGGGTTSSPSKSSTAQTAGTGNGLAQPTTKSAPKGPAKQTTLETVKAFAQKKRITLQQALKQAQQDGYVVKGQ